MRISVLIPSEEYKNFAGARIRYGRIAPVLSDAGHSLILENVAEFDPSTSECDVLLISKCYDARALIAAQTMSNQGRIVGFDLFDDYFSQQNDSRLTRYRIWLRQLVDLSSFALCSTPSMASIIQMYRKDIPVHVMNDPAFDFRTGEMPALLATKLTEARTSRRIRLLWFGVGDNPHFPVGIADLAAFLEMIAKTNASDFEIELTVLTNPRALDAEGLALLNTMPIRPIIEEWSETRESELLENSVAAFLPVNAQNFSVAKSLNRAITALNAGCQIISVGYPLYEPLGQLVYRDFQAFMNDVEVGEPRLNQASLAEYNAVMDNFASTEKEARHLATFLDGVPARSEPCDTPMALIHGHTTSRHAHQLAQKLGWLSVGSPFCTSNFGFDVQFRGHIASGGLHMLVSKRALHRLSPDIRKKAQALEDGENRGMWSLADSTNDIDPFDWAEAPLALQLAAYQPAMLAMERQIAEAFSSVKILVSETSTLPFAPPSFTGNQPA